jgi:hypothetical protein
MSSNTALQLKRVPISRLASADMTEVARGDRDPPSVAG